MKSPYAHIPNGSEKLVGPWPCERCGHLSQYAVVKMSVNRVFCKNDQCGYERIVDKFRHRIVEADGTTWVYDSQGNKRQVRGQ